MLDLEVHVALHECCAADLYRCSGQSVAVFKNVQVQESERRKGYGNELLTTLESIARALGCESSVLWTHKSEWMHDWYKRRGYEDYEDYDDPAYVWMWKPLQGSSIGCGIHGDNKE